MSELVADIEKVVKGLSCLARTEEPMANPCAKCDYKDRANFAFCVVDVAKDALELLKDQHAEIEKLKNLVNYKKKLIEEYKKDQQPKEPMQLKYSETREEYWFYESICPQCGNRWISNGIDHFCPACGQPVFEPCEEEQKDGEQE